MNNICCLLSPQDTCYYCEAVWCTTCWHQAFVPTPWNFTICTKGAYRYGGHGGHYTMNYGETLRSERSEVERYRIKPMTAKKRSRRTK